MKKLTAIFIVFLLAISNLSGEGIDPRLADFMRFNDSNPVNVKIFEKAEKHDIEKLLKLPEEELPIEVKVGTYIMSVDLFDYAKNTFSSTFWIWFVYDEKYENIISPHETFELLNSINIEEISSFKEKAGDKIWSGKKLRATFKYNWDLTMYPVDKQALEIKIEESERESHQIKYIADIENSGMLDVASGIRGWKINGIELFQDDVKYKTNYGDPTIDKDEGSTYSDIIIKLKLHRNTLSTFFKLNMVIFIAFAISWLSVLISFIKYPQYLAARIAILVSMIYAIVLNIQYVDNIMGTTPTFTLPDKMQFTTLIMIFVFFIHLIITYKLIHANRIKSAHVIDRIVFIFAPVLYILTLALISLGII